MSTSSALAYIELRNYRGIFNCTKKPNPRVRIRHNLAGVAGFEPTNDGVRGRPELLATQYIVFILIYKRHILCVFMPFQF